MRFLIYLLFAFVFFLSCRQRTASSDDDINGSAAVARHIKQGDSIYAKKAGYNAFLQSMEHYDSAWQMAHRLGDTLLIADAVFARGRAYDAINNNPQKTIDQYKEAARLFAALPGNYEKSLYIKHLVAHSYDKVNDSAACVKVLQELYTEIKPKPDSVKQRLRFIAEMALISTVVKNYALAGDILTHLTKRSWIKNDAIEYDYLNHYYLTKARLDVFKSNKPQSPYLDSLETVFDQSKNFSDSAFFANELLSLHRKTGDSAKAAKYERINFQIAERINNPAAIQKMQTRLSQMEVAAVESKRSEEEALVKSRNHTIYVLGALLLVITALVFFLVRKNRENYKKSGELQVLNEELQQKNVQNELLNLEMQHRVKNNLNTVLSLLEMQERKSSNNETVENLRQARLRIESIALLHEHLLNKGQSAVVDLEEFIRTMVKGVVDCFANGRVVKTNINTAGSLLPPAKNLPMALILNEWVTNSLKHADTQGKPLAISFLLTTDGTSIIADYHDNGIAPLNQSTKPSGLGHEIIKLLCRQMKGILTTKENSPFAYQLTLPNGK